MDTCANEWATRTDTVVVASRKSGYWAVLVLDGRIVSAVVQLGFPRDSSLHSPVSASPLPAKTQTQIT